MKSNVTAIALTEYETQRLARDRIPEAVAVELYQNYSKQIEIEFPNYKTGDRWQLKAKGWVGYITVTPEFSIKINPKVTLTNLFGMLEYAYNLKGFRFLEGLIDCNSIEDFYDRLANLLAQRIRDRTRKGLYRAYLPQTRQLGYLRGRLDTRDAIRKPWDVKLTCHYDEQTSDSIDNQILAWTLNCIARSGLCRDRTRSPIRQAYRPLIGCVTLRPVTANDCRDRTYNRLNQDYQPLHALCRFFLENLGPTHQTGNASILPFLVDMAKLYERFVAEWLKAHSPSNYSLTAQERIEIGSDNHLYFNLDLVFYHNRTGQATYVLDTKYKTDLIPADIQQAIAYAVSKDCQQAILVYPEPLSRPIDEAIGNIRIRSLTFSLNGDLDRGGQEFLDRLIV